MPRLQGRTLKRGDEQASIFDFSILTVFHKLLLRFFIILLELAMERLRVAGPDGPERIRPRAGGTMAKKWPRAPAAAVTVATANANSKAAVTTS